MDPCVFESLSLEMYSVIERAAVPMLTLTPCLLCVCVYVYRGRGVKCWRYPSPFSFIFFSLFPQFVLLFPFLLSLCPSCPPALLHCITCSLSFPVSPTSHFFPLLSFLSLLFPVNFTFSFCPPTFAFLPSIGDRNPRAPLLLFN